MLGQDTEFFVYDTALGGVVPAHSVGIAKEKTQIPYAGSYFRDGYAIEFNAPASSCRSGVWENLAKTMDNFKNGFREQDVYNEKTGYYETIKNPPAVPSRYKLITDPCATIDLSEIKSWPKDLHVLGCHPTYDAYGECEKVVEVDPLELDFRTTGAHLHHSAGSGFKPTLSQLGLYAKYCDLLVGLPHTIIYGDDMEFKRRTLYGQAGEFRKQEYKCSYGPGTVTIGFEYRVLSSRLYNHPGIFGLLSAIFKYTLERYGELDKAGWNKKLDAPLRKAINTGVGATELLEEFSSSMKLYQREDKSGMNGLGYIPKDWGAAILKLREMRKKADSPLNRFLMWEGQLQGHWGWSECNDHNAPFKTASGLGARTSTVCHKPIVQEEPWLL